MSNEGKIKIELRAFGGFSFICNGRECMPGRITSKTMQLFVLLALQGARTRSQIMEDLYETGSIASRNNSFNNLVYQLRRQFTSAGMPDSDYIVRDGDNVRITDAVDIDSDVARFRELIRRGQGSSSEEETAEAYRQAVMTYRGDLLTPICTEVWVLMIGSALRQDYERALEYVCLYDRNHHLYDDMYKISTIASDIYPDMEWQKYRIEALVRMDRQREALELYNDTVDYYRTELGVSAVGFLGECAGLIAEYAGADTSGAIDARSDILSTYGAEETGAYECSYSSFIDNYHLLSRNMKRAGYTAYMMMLTIIDYEGKRIINKDKLSDRSAKLRDAIRTSLRIGDAYTRYSADKYLALLVGTTEDDCEVVYKRIRQTYKKLAGTRADIEYSVVSVAQLEE